MSEIKLINAKKNIKYKIIKIFDIDEKLLTNLKNFGIKQGNYVMLLGSNYGRKSYLISVDGINYAVDKSVCERVIVDA